MGIIGWLYPAMGYVNELESKSQLPTTVIVVLEPVKVGPVFG